MLNRKSVSQTKQCGMGDDGHSAVDDKRGRQCLRRKEQKQMGMDRVSLAMSLGLVSSATEFWECIHLCGYTISLLFLGNKEQNIRSFHYLVQCSMWT